MKTVTTLGNLHKRKYKKRMKEIDTTDYAEYESSSIDTKATMINALIPLGLMMVRELVDDEITGLLGAPYEREARPNGYVRYGSNPGSVKLAGQRFKVQVPRVRDLRAKKEVKLESMEALKEQGATANETLLKRVLYGISCRNYAQAAEAIPEALGLSPSTVSRKFIEASESHLRELNSRDLSKHEFTALVIDGKSCAQEMMLIVVGITTSGRKIPLGLAQLGTENERAVSDFLRGLKARGLSSEDGVLVVIDGSKGLHAAVRKIFAGEAVIQRCQWHKRENVVGYLPKNEQELWRKKLQNAYQKATYKEAKQALEKIRSELALKNQSALASLDEGFEETLTLHRLGLFEQFGFSLKTTNILESINSLIEKSCSKVSRYKNSSQRLRWYAAALIDIEPRLNRINGCQHMNKLRLAIQQELGITEKKAA